MAFQNDNLRPFNVMAQAAALANRSAGAPRLILLEDPIPGAPKRNEATVELNPGLYLVSAMGGLSDRYAYGEWPSRYAPPVSVQVVANRAVLNPGPGVYILQLSDPSIIPWAVGSGYVVGPPSAFAWFTGNIESSHCEMVYIYKTTRRAVIEIRQGEVVECYGSHGSEVFHLIQVSDGWECAKSCVFMRNVCTPDHSWHDQNRPPQGELLPADGSQRLIRVAETESVEVFIPRAGCGGTVVNFVPIGSALKTGERD